MDFNSHFFDDGRRRIHYVQMGDPSKPLILCLHGFPEYWGAWRELMPLLAENYHVVAPDQRGFAESFKPTSVEAYQSRYLVEDVAALADYLSPDQPFVLFGHDWGSAVAYAYAFGFAERLKALIVANGVHPYTFQKAIIDDPDQRAASQYMTTLRRRNSTELMSRDQYARTLNMIAGFSTTQWMSDEAKADYLRAWSADSAMDTMLNWYRSSPIIVPPADLPASELEGKVPILSIPPAAMTVSMPHLVVWGEGDEALRPVCLEGLDRFCSDLTVTKVSGAGHWILHEEPEAVATLVGAWLDEKSVRQRTTPLH